MRIADAVRSSGIAVGDVIEISMEPDWLAAAISEAISDAPAWRDGLLIEITAIGEQYILGFALVGEQSLRKGETYRAYTWARMTEYARQDLPANAAPDSPPLFIKAPPKERMFARGATVRKVGSKPSLARRIWNKATGNATGYVWTMPDLVNIYTRCQGPQA